MQKDSQSYKLMELIAISGELPADAVRRLEGNTKYKEKIITDLKKEKLIKTHYKDQLRGYRLTAKAKKSLLESAPERFMFYFNGEVITNHVSSNIVRRFRLHRIAETVITMNNAGVKIFRDDKPDVFYNESIKQPVQNKITVTEPAFYGSREFKELGHDMLKLKNARAVGILLTAKDIFFVYNTEDASMKWAYKAEISAKGVLKYHLCQKRMPHQYNPESVKGLIFGNNMDMLFELITGTDGKKRNYFFLDGAYEYFVFLTNDEHGDVLLKILCDYDMQKRLNSILGGDLKPPDRGMTIENDALDDAGNPVLFSYLIDMPRLARFSSALASQGRTGNIICFDFQKDALEKYCGEHVSFDTIDFAEFKRVFMQ